MERKGLARLAPLEGVVFLLLVVAGLVLSNDTPTSDDSIAETVEYWTDNEAKEIASSILIVLAAATFVVFAGSVRQAIARAEEPGVTRLASVAFAGAVIFSMGMAINANLEFATAESAGEVSPQTTEALSTLYSDFWYPMAIGMGLFGTSAGIAALRHGALDRRLGWIALILGILCFTPVGFFAILGMIIWSAITGVSLYRGAEPSVRSDPPGGGDDPPASSGPPPIEIPPGTAPPAPS